MSKHERDNLPPLSEEAESAISAFRTERPSLRLQSRLHAALQAAEADRRATAAPASPRRAAARRSCLHHPATRMLMGAALASMLVILGGRTEGLEALVGNPGIQSEVMPSRQVSFQLPGEGAGWLELPWSRGVHSGGRATVRLETPAELDFHQHAGDLPALRLVSCEAGRCIHQFTADTGSSATPLRVRIDKPGRYEFRVSHTSDIREVHEHFVVLAGH